MTRINVGVDPSELCDQHLAAEYRELPRAFRGCKATPPAHFKLGAGHVAWCAQYPGMLADRFLAIVAECERRGRHVTYPRPPEWALSGARPPSHEVTLARPLVLERIAERLRDMNQRGNVPRWTRR